MRAYLIRHPSPAIEPGVCYGRLEVDLSTDGYRQIDAVVARLPRVQAVLSSPTRRCLPLAQRLAARDALVPMIDGDLCELDFGQWEGKRWDTIDRAAIDLWAEDVWNHAPPGGESYAHLSARTLASLARIAAGPAQEVAVCTHGGPIRAALADACGTPQTLPAQTIPFSAVFALELRDYRWVDVTLSESNP